jgi:hypothetical protein
VFHGTGNAVHVLRASAMTGPSHAGGSNRTAVRALSNLWILGGPSGQSEPGRITSTCIPGVPKQRRMVHASGVVGVLDHVAAERALIDLQQAGGRASRQPAGPAPVRSTPGGQTRGRRSLVSSKQLEATAIIDLVAPLWSGSPVRGAGASECRRRLGCSEDGACRPDPPPRPRACARAAVPALPGQLCR